MRLSRSPWILIAVLGLLVVDHFVPPTSTTWAMSIVNEEKDDGQSSATAKPDSETTDKNDEVAEKSKDEPATTDDPPKSDQDEAKADADDKKKDEKQPTKVELKGQFVADESTAVSLRLEEWTNLEVVMAAEHGQKVRKGDVLLRLRTDKLDLALEGLRHDVELGKISVEEAEGSLALLCRSTPLSIAAAERAERRATENLKRFLTIDKEASEESVEFSLRNSKNYVAYQEEELKQLKQMYEEDDLTEETEEIILKRTKDEVDNARFSLQRTELSHDRSLQVELPERQEDLETAVQQAALELERAQSSLPSKIVQDELRLKKLQLSQKEMESKLNRMESDRELMTVKAPLSGVVYYGECKQGKWADATQFQSMLRPHGAIKSDQVFMTIVQTRPVHILAEVTEKDIRHAQEGRKVVVTATALPKSEFKGELRDVAQIPSGDGKFSAIATVDLPEAAASIVPGMSCTLSFELEDPATVHEEGADAADTDDPEDEVENEDEDEDADEDEDEKEEEA